VSPTDILSTTRPADAAAGSKLAGDIEALCDRLRQVRRSIGRVIFGQQETIDQALITLLAGGHVLLIGVPGLAKTRLVHTLGTVLGLEDKRVQSFFLVGKYPSRAECERVLTALSAAVKESGKGADHTRSVTGLNRPATG